MKRLIAIVTAAILSLALFSGCRQAEAEEENSGKISIVCTIFPQYDWTRQIIGDNEDSFDLTLLLQNKADLHSYQPSVEDIAAITSCDLFVYVGGESDEWAEDVLEQAVNPDMAVLNLLDVLGGMAKLEEIVEGMEEEEEEEEEEAYDEHVWLSLRNAQVFCASIADAVAQLDPGNADTYQSNLESYLSSLSDLDSQYQAAIDSAAVKTLLFADRFPFRYLTDDYGIDYYAAFPGCSAETEASFATMVFLTEKVDELDLRNIMVTESSDQSIAATIVDSSREKDQQIHVLNAMQSIAAGDLRDGATYLSIMENNLNVLKEALK